MTYCNRVVTCHQQILVVHDTLLCAKGLVAGWLRGNTPEFIDSRPPVTLDSQYSPPAMHSLLDAQGMDNLQSGRVTTEESPWLVVLSSSFVPPNPEPVAYTIAVCLLKQQGALQW